MVRLFGPAPTFGYNHAVSFCGNHEVVFRRGFPEGRVWPQTRKEDISEWEEPVLYTTANQQHRLNAEILNIVVRISIRGSRIDQIQQRVNEAEVTLSAEWSVDNNAAVKHCFFYLSPDCSQWRQACIDWVTRTVLRVQGILAGLERLDLGRIFVLAEEWRTLAHRMWLKF